MTHLAARPWVPTESYIQSLAELTARQSSADVAARIEALMVANNETSTSATASTSTPRPM